MIIKDYVEIDEILKGYAGLRVILTTHQNPDGDGLCACFAMALCLRHIYNAQPEIVIDSEVPESMQFLNYQQFQILKQTTQIPLLLVIDCHETDRVDTDADIFKKAQRVVVIDHHIAKPEKLHNEYMYYIDTTAASTGMILHRFLYKYTPRLTPQQQKDYADFIYMTILNDTDNYLNSNTDAEVFRSAAELMTLGLQPHIIANEFLYKKPIRYFKFIGQMLSTIEIRGKIAHFYATLQMLEENGLDTDSYSKIMRWTKGTYDVDIIVFFAENEDDLWRMSFRSENIDVAKIAQHFDGGGHKKAAGCQLKGKYPDIKEKILAYIESNI